MPVAHHRDLAQYRKRHRNRRKYLRQLYQAGQITAQERERLRVNSLVETRALANTAADPTGRSAAYHRAVAAGQQYMAGHPPNHGQGWCNPECVGADGPTCVCWCEGLNHGAGKISWEDVRIPGGRKRKAEVSQTRENRTPTAGALLAARKQRRLARLYER